MEKNYTPLEMAKMLNVHENTIYKKVRDGELKKVPCMGRSVRIPESELKKFGMSESEPLEVEVKTTSAVQETKEILRNQLINENVELFNQIEKLEERINANRSVIEFLDN